MPNAAMPADAKHYQHKPTVIRAVRITEPMICDTPHGPISGKPGDWLCEGPEGEMWFNAEAMFASRYEEADIAVDDDP